MAWYSCEKPDGEGGVSFRETKKEREREGREMDWTHRNLVHSNLSVILLGFQLELDVQAEDLGVVEALRLLLESGVREGLLEGDSSDEEGVLFESEVDKVEGQLDMVFLPSLLPASLRDSEPFREPT